MIRFPLFINVARTVIAGRRHDAPSSHGDRPVDGVAFDPGVGDATGPMVARTASLQPVSDPAKSQ
jgi:hypothetical protein